MKKIERELTAYGAGLLLLAILAYLAWRWLGETSPSMTPLLWVAVVAVFAIVIAKLAETAGRLRKIRWNKPDALRTDLKKETDRYCYRTVAKRYRESGKDIHTQKGTVKAAFRHEMEKERAELENAVCGNDGIFRADFREMSRRLVPEAKRCDFGFLADMYRKDLREREYRRQRDFLKRGDAVSPEQFLEIHRTQKLGDFVGVYVIYNVTKDKVYVGQSKKVVSRVKQHIAGRGNGDVHADMENGDIFEIHVYPLQGSGYYDIDALERDMISFFHASKEGYNKQKGNGEGTGGFRADDIL